MPDNLNLKLGVRRAETVASYLNGKGQGRITAVNCRYKTPEQIAVMFLGGNAGKAELKRITREIYEAAGLDVPEAYIQKEKV